MLTEHTNMANGTKRADAPLRVSISDRNTKSETH